MPVVLSLRESCLVIVVQGPARAEILLAILIEYLGNYWLYSCEILCRHSEPTKDTVLQVCWSPDFIIIAIIGSVVAIPNTDKTDIRISLNISAN